MKIVVIIPTYNEEGGIGSVLDELQTATEQLSRHEWVALVVDGHSTDETCRIVREKSYKSLSVHLLEEKEKSGIAHAYFAGITHAVTVLGADVFVEFDGDGQHNPQDLLPMIAAVEHGADYVIGSRYVPGGSVPSAWAFYRKLLSRFGSLYARMLLELPVHDVTSGFKMTRVQGFKEHLPKTVSDLLSREYAYKIQFLTLMLRAGARVVEIPIAFRARENDSSKSTSKDIVESLRVTARLRLTYLRDWRLPRVVAIGTFGFVIQLIIFEWVGIRWEILTPSLAAVIGGEFAVLSNFFFNERYSFGDRIKAAAPLAQRLTKFHLVSSGSILTQWVLLSTAEHLTNDALALRLTFFLGVSLGFVINYTGYYFFVWREKDP